MNPKITPDHLSRRAIVYIRQSSQGRSCTIRKASYVNTDLPSRHGVWVFIRLKSSTRISAARVPDRSSEPDFSVLSPRYAPGRWARC